MKEFSSVFRFKELIFRAQRRNWCANWNCTTCGAMYLRPRLEKFTREEIIEGLKALPNSFVDNPKSTEILVFCFYAASIFGTGYDLVEPLKDSPVSRVLDCALSKSYRKTNYEEPSIQERRLNRVIKLRERAKKHIWGAVRRKDYKAIEIMLNRGID